MLLKFTLNFPNLFCNETQITGLSFCEIVKIIIHVVWHEVLFDDFKWEFSIESLLYFYSRHCNMKISNFKIIIAIPLSILKFLLSSAKINIFFLFIDFSPNACILEFSVFGLLFMIFFLFLLWKLGNKFKWKLWQGFVDVET